MDNLISLLTNLIESSLSGHHNSLKMSSIPSEVLIKLLKLAKKHDVTAIIGSELIAHDLITQDHTQIKIQDAVCEAVCYYEKMNYEFHWLCDLLEDAHIPFIPLKGAVIRDYYPEPWLRTSGDIDILIQDSFLDEAVSLLLQKGCRLDREKRFHDIPLITPGGILLELHFNIRENIAALDQMLDKVWQYSEPVPGKRFQHQQTNAFLLFHLLAHMSYHLINGGCGIRSFADIWLLENHLNYDRKLLQSLCCEAQLDLFYHNVNYLIGVWFEGKKHNFTSKSLEQLVITGGSFGNADNRILISQAKIGSRNKHMLHRIFKPYDELKTQFPALEQKPWLTPAFQIIRWGCVFTDGRLRSVITELHTSQDHSQDQIAETKVLLENVGLSALK